MPATSPQAIARRQALTRNRMWLYRQNYPEKARATIRACYWRKRVRALRAQLAEAEARVREWERQVERLRWRHE